MPCDCYKCQAARQSGDSEQIELRWQTGLAEEAVWLDHSEYVDGNSVYKAKAPRIFDHSLPLSLRVGGATVCADDLRPPESNHVCILSDEFDVYLDDVYKITRKFAKAQTRAENRRDAYANIGKHTLNMITVVCKSDACFSPAVLPPRTGHQPTRGNSSAESFRASW